MSVTLSGLIGYINIFIQYKYISILRVSGI